MSNEEKKSCNICAYLNYLFAGDLDRGEIFFESFKCKRDNSSINKGELNSKSCKEFISKKEGMTLAQQIEEQKQEEIKKQQLAEQARLKKEHDRLPNRLRRNWYYVSALVIGIIGLAITIWRFLLNN